MGQMRLGERAEPGHRGRPGRQHAGGFMYKFPDELGVIRRQNQVVEEIAGAVLLRKTR